MKINDMKASEFIKVLQAEIKKHGDLPVCISAVSDYDYGTGSTSKGKKIYIHGSENFPANTHKEAYIQIYYEPWN